MSVVLLFPKNHVSKRAAGELLNSAEIVIFPGVRIERRSFDAAKTILSPKNHRASQAAIDAESLHLT
jgi:hypothetical protein